MHGKMKGAFSWNPDCSTFSIFIMTNHPLWCGLCSILTCVCVPKCMSVEESNEKRQKGRGREKEREEEIDKQSENKGVA